MKQLTLAGGAAFAVPARPVPAPAAPCASPRLGSGSVGTRPSALELMTYAAKGRFGSLHGATGRMVIPTNDADRRPPETPT